MKLLFYSFRTLTMLRVRLIMLLWLMAMGGAWLGTAPILSVVKDGTEHATLTAQFAPLPERLGVALALGLHERLEPLAPTVMLFVVLGGIWSIFVMGAIYGLLEREGQGSSPPLLELLGGGRSAVFPFAADDPRWLGADPAAAGARYAAQEADRTHGRKCNP